MTYQRYLVQYEYEGSQWNIELPATSFEDAQRRLLFIGMTAEVCGTIAAVLPARLGWLARLWCRVAGGRR